MDRSKSREGRGRTDPKGSTLSPSHLLDPDGPDPNFSRPKLGPRSGVRATAS